MKNILCLICLVALLFPSVSLAQQVSEGQARERAKEFFLSKERRTSNSSVRKAMKQRSESQLTLATQDSTYYVFNVGESQGFVVVSGDERTTPVLGYADKGHFEEDNLPEGLKQLLGQYQSEMKTLKEMGVQNAVPRNLSETKRPAIEPLLRTAWGQEDPYNRMCPEQSVTGCVATAAAQIMDYHHWPAATTLTIPGYTSGTSQYEIPDLEPTTFDWEQIARHEKGREEQITDESCDAVAKLMYYVGASLEMNYTTWESGSSHFMAVPALQQYFDYDAYLLERDAQSSLFWDDILYNELSHGRPMLYVGSMNSLQSAHAFVCDGYDGEGRFHFDWGWDGDENGYFVPTAIPVQAWLSRWPVDGFSAMQGIIGGIRPKGTVLAEDDRMQELLDAVENYAPQSTDFLSVEKVEVENGNDYDLLHVTLHNSGTEDFDDQFFVYGTHILGASSVDCRYMKIPAGGSTTTDFYAYEGNTTFSISTNGGFYANADAQLWKDEKHSYFLFANGEDIVIPEDVSAAYLSCDLIRVTPNSNPNTLYYTYDQALQQDFEDKNVVLGTNCVNFTVDNHYSLIIPLEFNASNATMKASLSASETTHALSVPFDATMPEGVTAMQYNYNDEGQIYFAPVDRIWSHGMYLVSTDKESVEFIGKNVNIESIIPQDTELFPMSHRHTYGATMENVYMYDAAKNAFVAVANAKTEPFSFVLVANNGRNPATVLEVTEDSSSPYDSLGCNYPLEFRDAQFNLIKNETFSLETEPWIGLTFYNVADSPIRFKLELVSDEERIEFYNPVQFYDLPDGFYRTLVTYRAYVGGLRYQPDGHYYEITKDGDMLKLQLCNYSYSYNVETRVEGGQGGTVSPVINGKVKQNTVLHLEAKPDEGWDFLKWVIQGSEFKEIYEPNLDYVVNAYVIIGAVFTPKQYHVTFMVDGETVYSKLQDYGTEIVAPEAPVKEGYSFVGWEPEIDTTVPLHDVTYEALFTINQYTLTYIVDEETYSVQTLDYGTSIEPLENLSKGGYTFSGWSWIPETMPAQDVIVIGSFGRFAGFDYCTILLEELSNTLDLFDSSNRDSISSMIDFYDNARYTLTEWNDGILQEIIRPVNDIIRAEMNNLYVSRFDADETQLLTEYPEKEESIKLFFERQRENYRLWCECYCPSLYAGSPYHSGKLFDYHEKQELQELLNKYYESAKLTLMTEVEVMVPVLPSTAFHDVAWDASTIIFNSYQTLENWDDPDPMPFVGEPEKDANGNAWYDVDYDESTACNNLVAGERLSWYTRWYYCPSSADSYNTVITSGIADLYYRRSFSIERPLYGDVYLFCSNVDQHELYINGEHVFTCTPEKIDDPIVDYMTRGRKHWKVVKLPDSVKEKLKTDGFVNVLAAKIHTNYWAFVDCGLYLLKGEIGKGDVNEDGCVNIADAAGVVNLIIENKTEHLNRKVADMNSDGDVSVADATLIIDKITRVERNLVKSVEKMDAENVSICINEQDVDAGCTFDLPVVMSNDAITALQMSIVLPEGISLSKVTTDSEHMATFKEQADGSIKIVALSFANRTFKGNPITLSLCSSADFDGGLLEVDGIELITNNLHSVTNDAFCVPLKVSGTTGIVNVNTSERDMPMYDLSGRRLQTQGKGIVISNGVKKFCR